jgi:hypothetical protein
MDSSKAKKAKSKATAQQAAKKKRTQSERDANSSQAMGNAYDMMASQGKIPGTGIVPEVQAQQIAMQDRTQTVSPYRNLGPKPNNYYNPGNVVGGGYVPGS